jgi:hypothetical protein
MDRKQHHRYLVYLRRYEYFGRGRRRLGMAEFAALEAELAQLSPQDPSTRERRAAILSDLLRD